MKRFKIDNYRYLAACPFALYVNQKRWWGADHWVPVKIGSTRDEVIAYYNKIKDLPEYLPAADAP